jgi:hypothetical protein
VRAGEPDRDVEQQRVQEQGRRVNGNEADRMGERLAPRRAEDKAPLAGELDRRREEKRGHARDARRYPEQRDHGEERAQVHDRRRARSDHRARQQLQHDARSTSSLIRPERTRRSMRSSARVCQSWFFHGVVRFASKRRWLDCAIA